MTTPIPRNVCPFESCGRCNAALWIIQNQWFKKHSSLASALGGMVLEGQKKNQEAFLRPPPVSLGDLGMYRGQDITSAPSDTIGGYLSQSTLEAAAREVTPQSASKPNASGHVFANGCVNDNISKLWTVVNLRGEVAHFCRVGPCIYWHTDLKQIKRHRDTHFEARYGWLCPNQTIACPWFGKNFRRRDQVHSHCKRFSQCRETLIRNGGKVECRGSPADDRDLVPYDPKYHVPYWGSDGRN